LLIKIYIIRKGLLLKIDQYSIININQIYENI